MISYTWFSWKMCVLTGMCILTFYQIQNNQNQATQKKYARTSAILLIVNGRFLLKELRL